MMSGLLARMLCFEWCQVRYFVPKCSYVDVFGDVLIVLTSYLKLPWKMVWVTLVSRP